MIFHTMFFDVLGLLWPVIQSDSGSSGGIDDVAVNTMCVQHVQRKWFCRYNMLHTISATHGNNNPKKKQRSVATHTK